MVQAELGEEKRAARRRCFGPCPAFAYTVLLRNESLLCKHILAVYLSQAMGVTQQEAVSNGQMSMLLSGTEAT